LDDLRPHIFRTHDGGKTWKQIVNGLPNGGIVNSVREDPVRKGLLFCGTEQAVYFSLDDGENWQPLRLNMPATSIRDLVIHNDDIVVGTHGRSFWILDDITPLRQIDNTTASNNAVLFKPQMATRVKRSVHTDTPYPPEEPAGQNPPDGAILNYYLRQRSATPVVLEIFDAAGKLVRRFRSDDKPLPYDEKDLRFPTYWLRPPQILKNESGMQRFTWDLLYPNPPADSYDLPISAIVRDTPFVPQGPAVMPGNYTVKLTVDGRTMSQQLNVRMDPRVTTPGAALQKQFDLSIAAYDGIIRARELSDEVKKFSETLAADRKKTAKDSTEARKLDQLEREIDMLLKGSGKPGTVQPVSELPLGRLAGAFTGLLDMLQDADVLPSTQASAAAADLQTALRNSEKLWTEIKSRK
jgi:hypothetical protein